MEGASRVCKPGGHLVLYGPFKIDGKPTTESNAAFDQSLRERDPSFGLRDFEDVNQKAIAAGFELVSKDDMPANNFICVWKRLSDSKYKS